MYGLVICTLFALPYLISQINFSAYALENVTNITELIQGSHPSVNNVTNNSSKEFNGNTTFQKVNNLVTSQSLKVPEKTELRIAFLEPTFTHAAYQNNSFYNFYRKYYPITTSGNEIKSDLNLLVNRKVPHGPIFVYNHEPGVGPYIPHGEFLSRIIQSARDLLPYANITQIDDEDVESGKLFKADGKNQYDVLVLGHEEYATRKIYLDLKKFVANGGSIIFAESNVLTVEVNYDKNSDSITFVGGHGYQYDGKIAKRNSSMEERWTNETSTWVGSNFLLKFDNAYFNDMPFRYNHTEEQYLTNGNATILHDYKIYDPNDQNFNPKVVAYAMNYGKGRVVMSGIFGAKLFEDDSFFKFFKYVMFPQGVGSQYRTEVNNTTYRVYSLPGSVHISDFTNVASSHSVSFRVNATEKQENKFVISIPREVFSLPDQGPNEQTEYNVIINNKTSQFDFSSLGRESGFSFQIPQDLSDVKIVAQVAHPPFILIAPPDIKITGSGEITSVKELGRPQIQGKPLQKVEITNDAPVKFPIGRTVVTWTAKDELGHVFKDTQIVFVGDLDIPNVKVVYPKDRGLVATVEGKVMINGTARDSTGVKKVEVLVHSLLEGEQGEYVEAFPINPNDWSHWSLPLDVTGISNPLEVVARVTDFSGHQNWDRIHIAVTKHT